MSLGRGRCPRCVVLTDSVESYLAVRRALGYQLRSDGYHLRSFAQFASRNRSASFVKVSTAIEWASQSSGPVERERRLQTVARFARYMRSEDRRHDVLPVNVFGRHHPSKRRPYIYSAEEIRALMHAASRLKPTGSIRPYVYVTLIGLLASTGLRVSEALALQVDDVRSDGLRILETKFHKSRLVPLHWTAAAALERYLQRRRKMRTFTERVFVNLAGAPMSYSNVQKAFYLLRCRALRHGASSASSPPRLHDLRHTFAVRALEAAPIGAQLLGRHMRALSTYMGHVSIASTYWYLQATPHLMRHVADACRIFFDGESP